ncbi:MAG: hypothetical protein A3G34_16395 [Candidatus Lindowbacteria bacterium RIFCSPLOWO2_12_FULL_62_27]|nr:MAG: hypothetical protein A3G34_16395 [Candidatus Lindowbacteria bacterium RIFCSPLOWO2_12_FULL_62_27]
MKAQDIVKRITKEMLYDLIDKRMDSLKEGLSDFKQDVGEPRRRMEHLKLRFDNLQSDINRRFEAMDRKFADLNRRIDQLYTAILNGRK